MSSLISRVAISLLLLASFINATATAPISLGRNFQELPSDVTGTCRATYNSPIEDCDAADFQDNSCSKECILSLDRLSMALNTDCVGVGVDSRTLLGVIFQGQLVDAVCNPSLEISIPKTTTRNTMLSRSTSDVATTTSDDTSARTTTSKAETVTESSTDLGPDDSQPTPTPTATVLTTETVVSSTSTSSAAAPTTALSREEEQIEAKNEGGANPFNLSTAGGAPRIGSSPVTVFMGALLAAVILIR